MRRLVKRLIVPTLLMMSVMVISCDSKSGDYSSSPPMHASDFKEMADEITGVENEVVRTGGSRNEFALRCRCEPTPVLEWSLAHAVW